MAITIGANISALRTVRRLEQTTSELGRVFERLASGQRIVHASDDAAGLAVISRLRSDARLANVAQRNVNDGISMLTIADGALQEINNILFRMGELAEQAASGLYSITQRSSLNLEFTALGSEISRIAASTKFNNIGLLNGSGQIVFQVGFDSASTSQITFLTSASQGTLDALALGINANLSYSLVGITNAAAENAARTALEAVIVALDRLSQGRGSLGATSNRLSEALKSVESQREALLSAESRIRDVDVAAETANLVRLAILQKTTTSILAQANQQPRLALQLLTGVREP